MTKSTPQLQADLAAIQAEIKRREAVETASAAGYGIENKAHGSDVWIEAHAAFCWSRYDYRVKPSPPKPRLGFFSVERGCPGGDFGYLRFDEKEASRGYGYDAKYIELTPEVEAILREHGKGLL